MELKKIRSNLNLTTKQLSNELGISLRTYQNYENGSTEMPFALLIKTADLLGVSIDYLLGHKTKSILHSDSFTFAQQNLIDKIKELDDDLCEIAEPTIEGLYITSQERKRLKQKLQNLQTPTNTEEGR